MKQALIVVDVQESFRSRPYFRAEELPGFLRNVQSLINRSRARGIPVVQVLHREGGDDPHNPFTEASGQVRAMPELTLQPEDADVILFNTCSVRERAQERVFHDLGRVRDLKLANPDLIMARLMLGDLYRWQGEREQAWKAYSEASALRPGDPGAEGGFAELEHSARLQRATVLSSELGWNTFASYLGDNAGFDLSIAGLGGGLAIGPTSALLVRNHLPTTSSLVP